MMLEMKFGHIDQVGDSNKKEEAGKYRVRLDEDNIVTGWLHLSKEQTRDNVDDYTLDKQTPVWCLLMNDYRDGVIGGCLVNQKNKQKETDPDIKQFSFKDGSFIKYDRKNHVYEVSIKGDGNKVNITCSEATIKATNIIVDGKLTVKDDAKFEGNINVDKDMTATGDVKGSEVKTVSGVKLSTHVHPYVDTPAGSATTSPPTPG